MDEKKDVFQGSVNWIARLIMLLTLVVFVAACGSSRQSTDLAEDDVDIDELLGEDAARASQTKSDEDEVLRLLGITQADETAAAEVSMNEEQADMAALEGDLDQLKDDLTKKDEEISELRSELTQKAMKISDLETKANARQIVRRTRGDADPSPEFKKQYQTALEEFKARNYRGAIDLFGELLLLDPGNSLSDNCQYWIGESYYGLGQYEQAIVGFEKVFSFARSNKSDDAQLKLGVCYLRLDDKKQALEEFERLLSNFPDSEYRSLGQRYISKL
ncbi:MAG: tetratricopeptide repeat protein [Calditrichaeota bacterium]|nr:tetratricopeptide repeat protein [Calditrichota bacterium]